GMAGGPLERELLHGAVAAVPVRDQDAPKAAVRKAVEDVTDDPQVRFHLERNRSGEFTKVRRHAVRQHRKHRHPERLSGFGRLAFGENAVDGEPKMGMLFGAAERQHGAVVVLQILLNLHPVHVRDAHGRLLSSLIRGASPLGLPYSLSRSPLRRLAPVPPPLTLQRDIAETPSARSRARGSLTTHARASLRASLRTTSRRS